MSQVSKMMAPNVTSTTYHVQDCKESGVRIPSQEHTKPDTGTEEVREKREREPVKAMEKCPYDTDMGTMARVHT